MASPKKSKPLVVGYQELFDSGEPVAAEVPEGYFSSEEIAKQTGKSKRSIYELCSAWRREGKVEYVKVGCTYYYKR